MKKLLTIIALFAAFSAGAQTIYRTNDRDYANIAPIQIAGFATPVYLTRIHVHMPNDGTTVNVSYELEYSLDSMNYSPSTMHSGSFSLPVNQNTSPADAKANVFNYIRTSTKLSFTWE